MTNEELNRKIVEIRGHRYRCPILDGGDWCSCADYTHSEYSAAVLRNDLKAHFPYFSITFNRDRHKIEFEASGVEGGFAIDIPTDDELEAVAEVWLRWKNVP